MATLYKIVRSFYSSKLMMEKGLFYREYTHPFEPLTLKEAYIIKNKLSAYPNSIDHIIPLGEVNDHSSTNHRS